MKLRLIAAFMLTIALAFAGTKYDMVYGLTVPADSFRSKTIPLWKGDNSVRVTPDNTSNSVSCAFMDTDGNMLKADRNVKQCVFNASKENKEPIVVKIKSEENHNITVELKHVVK